MKLLSVGHCFYLRFSSALLSASQTSRVRNRRKLSIQTGHFSWCAQPSDMKCDGLDMVAR